MPKIPKKVEERIKKGIKRYQHILRDAQTRDIKESDTVLIVTDMLSDIFGYDKYTEITTEYAIRGTYCDLAIKSGDEPIFLIEVKAIGIELKDKHLRQALDYAVNKGVDWVVLTNGIEWRVYKTLFKKPIDKEQVFTLNLLDASSRDIKVVEMLFVLSKEGIKKAAISELREEMQATNRFTIATLIQTKPVLSAIRREIRRLYKGIKVTEEELHDVIVNEVLKRDVIEGEKAEGAEKKIKRLISKSKRKKKEEVKCETKPENG